MKIKNKILIALLSIIISTNIFTNSIIYAVEESNNIETSTNEVQNTESTIRDTSPEANNLTIYSEAAILMEADTGKVLIGKNENVQKYPASITKVLTAIIAIEKCQLTDKITASRSAVMSIPNGYSNAAIQPDETLTVQELLDLFLIHSANEVGFIFAEHISGSIENFATLMNQKAVEIGCTNTHFTNPSGIHDVNHYTTAYDMALITRYCMQNETFRQIVAKTSCTVGATDKYEERHFSNTNDLINPSSKYYYEGAIGVKTGFTTPAKNCLIGASLRDNLELIFVSLGAQAASDGRSGRYVDAITLFDWGYANYKNQEIITSNSVVDEITVSKATKDSKNLPLLIKDTITSNVPVNFDLNNLNYSIELNENITAPIAEGAVLGKVTYNIDGITYASDLLASHNVEKSNFILLVCQIALAIIVLIVLSKLVNNKKTSKRKKVKKKYTKKNDSIYKFQ